MNVFGGRMAARATTLQLPPGRDSPVSPIRDRRTSLATPSTRVPVIRKPSDRPEVISAASNSNQYSPSNTLPAVETAMVKTAGRASSTRARIVCAPAACTYPCHAAIPRLSVGIVPGVIHELPDAARNVTDTPRSVLPSRSTTFTTISAFRRGCCTTRWASPLTSSSLRVGVSSATCSGWQAASPTSKTVAATLIRRIHRSAFVCRGAPRWTRLRQCLNVQRPRRVGYQGLPFIS